MSAVMNLNRARKARARAEAKARADANAVKHGRGKAERDVEKARSDLAQRRLDAHKRTDDGP